MYPYTPISIHAYMKEPTGALLDTLNPLGKTVRELARDNVLNDVRNIERSLLRWLDESL